MDHHGSVTVQVRVQPKSSRNEIQGWKNGSLRVRTTAAPADGRANRDVARQLALAYGVPQSRVELLRGASARDKLFRISGSPVEPEFPDLDA
ncbi:MAG: DUF167 domain-containing protein [Gammaproteobacteria bacterium]|nr:DUF167 domain-containing protein [Gammaproteobacteria bacterium]MDH4256401.1 DUF167 domain-containing protein [Gammaproteobacteria bacterium]MDH5309293.1 DUF167 domain-containing protein [Gammaproteobacteria bacterium]